MNKLTLYEVLPFLSESIQSGSEALFTPGGRSMKPMLRDGKDTVALKKAQFPLKKYDLPLYRRVGGALVLHRVISVQDGKYTMRGDNTYTKEPGITEEQVIGVVIRFQRKGQWYSVQSLGYRMYCVLWQGLLYPFRHIIHGVYSTLCRGGSFLKRRIFKIK